MENIIEARYPINFRQRDAKNLGEHLKNRHNVVLIGMRRVGINNFLRFFLYHEDVIKTYIGDEKKHLFIPIDLFDLVEREIFPFWTLTFKRIVDSVNRSGISEKSKKHVESIFLHSIQSHNLFLSIDGIRDCLLKIVEQDFLPTVFFNRFDRMKSSSTPALFDNFQGLREATHGKLSYVFTSFRNLDKLAPLAFDARTLSSFSYPIYLRPGERGDIKVIFDTYKKRYTLPLSPSLEQALLEIVDGYTQYLHLALISIHEQKPKLKTKEELFNYLISDERIALQSEELWESLEDEEKEVMKKLALGKEISQKDKNEGKYLWDTGFLEKNKIFSPLFIHYVKQKEEKKQQGNLVIEFSKKEHALFMFLKLHKDNICEREQIIEAVWPEVEAFGVSDWAIDRLVARVRHKLKLQKNAFEILTVKTRGYKLIAAS